MPMSSNCQGLRQVSGPRVVCIIALNLMLPGCDAENQKITKPKEYTFLVGPEPRIVSGEERRQIIRMPSKYIETKREESPIRLGQFTFAVQFPGGKPVPHDKLGFKDVLVISVISEPNGSIKRRVDGSWQNHFSGYWIKKGNMHGLNIYGRSEWFQQSLIYVSEDMNTLVECEKIVNNKAMNCVMMNQMFDSLVVQISFDPSFLPHWKEMLFLAAKLIGQPTPYKGN